MRTEWLRDISPPDPLAVVIGIEATFGITIPDEDAELIRTMGQLYDYVFARVARGQSQVCLTSAAFYRLRQALMEVCGLPRGRVRPQARMDDLIPLEDRSRYWHALRDRLTNLHLPELRRPTWLVNRIGALSMVPLALTVLCSIVLLHLLRETPAATIVAILSIPACLLIGIAGLFLVTWLCYGYTEHHAVEIPASCGTVRDMVYALISGEGALRIVSDRFRATDKEIWCTLCSIVGDELHREPASFTRDSTFT